MMKRMVLGFGALVLAISAVGCSSSSSGSAGSKPEGVKVALERAGFSCDIHYESQSGAEYSRSDHLYEGDREVVAETVVEAGRCWSSKAGSVDISEMPGTRGTEIVPAVSVDFTTFRSKDDFVAFAGQVGSSSCEGPPSTLQAPLGTFEGLFLLIYANAGPWNVAEQWDAPVEDDSAQVVIDSLSEEVTGSLGAAFGLEFEEFCAYFGDT